MRSDTVRIAFDTEKARIVTSQKNSGRYRLAHQISIDSMRMKFVYQTTWHSAKKSRPTHGNHSRLTLFCHDDVALVSPTLQLGSAPHLAWLQHGSRIVLYRIASGFRQPHEPVDDRPAGVCCPQGLRAIYLIPAP